MNPGDSRLVTYGHRHGHYTVTNIKALSLSPVIDFIFQLLQRIDDRVEIRNFPKDHQCHIAVIGSQFSQVSAGGDEFEGSRSGMAVLTPRRTADSWKSSRRWSAGKRDTLSIDVLPADFSDGGVDPPRRGLRVGQYFFAPIWSEPVANSGLDLGGNSICSKGFKCLHNQCTFAVFKSCFLQLR